MKENNSISDKSMTVISIFDLIAVTLFLMGHDHSTFYLVRQGILWLYSYMHKRSKKQLHCISLGVLLNQGNAYLRNQHSFLIP